MNSSSSSAATSGTKSAAWSNLGTAVKVSVSAVEQLHWSFASFMNRSSSLAATGIIKSVAVLNLERQSRCYFMNSSSSLWTVVPLWQQHVESNLLPNSIRKGSQDTSLWTVAPLFMNSSSSLAATSRMKSTAHFHSKRQSRYYFTNSSSPWQPYQNKESSQGNDEYGCGQLPSVGKKVWYW